VRQTEGVTFTTWINHTDHDAALPTGETLAAGDAVILRASV
jgi:beta-galactosidase